MSRIRCVGFDANALMDPFVPVTRAMFEVIDPSLALRDETRGCAEPCGHIVRKPSGPCGTTVALTAYACAAGGTAHGPVTKSTSIRPLNGGAPEGLRVSSPRQGVSGNSDSPPAPGDAKYPSISPARSVL